MDIRPGDVLEMKKEHPCGARRWEVLRVGMDFRLRCVGCGREVMLPRKKAEKALKKSSSQQTVLSESGGICICVTKVRSIVPQESGGAICSNARWDVLTINVHSAECIKQRSSMCVR